MFAINCRVSWDFLAFLINKLSDWKNSWCISCRSFCSVHIFTNYCHCWCSTSEFRFWSEGYCSVCCYCVSTNTWNCLRSWTIVKGCWNFVIHWYTAITFCETWFTCLSSTLLTNWSNWFSCWCNRSHSWCVLRCNSCTVLVNTFHSYACTCSCEWFFWYEGYCSIWSNCISSFAWNCLRSWAIFKGCWNFIIHWYTWVTRREAWFTRLCLTLYVCRSCWLSCWSHRSHSWCVGRRSFCSVHIFTNYCHCWCSTSEFRFWSEGYCSVCCYCVSTNTWNCLRSWTIVKCCWNFIVHRHTAVTFCETWFTCLCSTLYISRYCWSTSWCYWCYGWCVHSFHNCTILILALNHDSCCGSNKWFFWYEGYSSVWSNCVCTFTWNNLSSWTVNKCCRYIIVHWHCRISFSEAWFACLSSTLNISWCSWFCCWNYWSDVWCVRCTCKGTICIFHWNAYRKNFTWVSFVSWSEDHFTFLFIYCEDTDDISCRWEGIQLISWVTRIIVKFQGWRVHWGNWVPFCEGWFACLNNSLRSFWCSWLCCWSNWSYSWCVSCRSFGSVHIFTNHCHCWCFTNKSWVWCEGYSSICCYCIDTNSRNFLSSWTIFKGCRNCIVHRNIFMTCCEAWFTCLGLTLLISWSCWLSSWGYWCHCWCVSCSNWSTVLINTFHGYSCTCSCEWFFWYEGYSSIWSNCVSSFTWNGLRSWTIFEGCWHIIIHWDCRVTRCEAWCTCLCFTLDICRCCRFSCWNNWSNLRCVSCFSNCSVCIFTLNLNWNHITWVRFISWCEGYKACFFINCESTDFFTFWWFSNYRCSRLTIFIKKSNGILIDWCHWITFCEGYSSSLNHTLRPFWFSWACSRCYWCHCWCVLSSNWSTVLIDTFNRYACTCTCEWFFWDKGYSSVWSNCVSSFTWNCLGCWTIFKGCWCIIIHWDIWISWCEGWCTCLRLTLFVSRCCIFCSWCNWCYSWCISCRSFCSVLIFTNNGYRWCSSYEWFIWYKCHCSIWSYCVSTNTFYCLRCWAIVKCCWNIIVHWHTAIAFSKYRFTSLSRTLNICCFNWCSCWFNRSYSWCVGLRGFSSVLIFTDNGHCWCSSDKWFFWYKCNSTVCCYCVSTNTFNGLRSWSIVKCRWNIFVDFNSFLNAINRYSSTLEFRLTCLSSTLNICCFCWCCSWGYWNDFRCVSCIHLNTVWAFSLHLNRCYFTCVRLISWCESYSTSCWVDRECTNWCCSIFSKGWCAWNFITIIIQKCVAIVFNRDCFILTIYLNSCTFKGWCPCLSSTLDIFRRSWFSCWNSCYNCWCVTCIWSDGCCLTIFICNRRCRLDFHSSCSSNKVFFRCESHCSCSRIDCISSFTFNSYCCFISRLASCWVNQLLTCNLSSLIITQSECRRFCLRYILNVFRNFISWSKSNWIYSWCVSCWCFGSILIFTNNGYRWGSSSKAWFWYKCNCSICCYCVGTNTFNGLSCWSIVKCCWNILIHWYTAITFCEGWFAWLSGTLNTWCFCWCRSWCYCSYSRCISSRCFGSVLIFANNGHCWCSSNEWFFWYKCNSTVWSYCVGTNTFNGLSCWTVIKCCWNVFVNFNSLLNAIDRYSSTLEFRLTFLCSTLDVFCFSWCCFRCYRQYCWCVGCWSFCSVLIFANNGYSWCSSNEWFFWNKCHCSVWSNCVCTNSFNCLSCWTIIKCCWNSFINGNWFLNTIDVNSSTLEFRFTSLSGTLDICSFSWCRGWCHRDNGWCILSCNYCTILINTFNCDTFSSSSKGLLRFKGYSSIRLHSVTSLTWNNTNDWTVVKGRWNVIIYWYTWVTFSEGWFTSLCRTLNIFRDSWGCCWRYWGYCWCVGCWSFCSVLIFADNCHSWCSSDKWFLWYKCNSTVCCYCVCTDTFNSLSCCSIVKCCWNSFVDWNSFFYSINRYSSTLEFRLTFLSCALDVCCFCWCRSWCYWNNLRCVSCIHLDSVWAFSLNLNRSYFTCIRLISWCECYSTSCWVDRECTDWCCSIFSISWCRWNFVTIFI